MPLLGGVCYTCTLWWGGGRGALICRIPQTHSHPHPVLPHSNTACVFFFPVLFCYVLFLNQTQVFHEITQSPGICDQSITHVHSPTTRDIAYYRGFLLDRPLSAPPQRVKSCSEPLGLLYPQSWVCITGCTNPPKFTWRTELRSDGSSQNRSNRRFICYCY